MCNFIPVRNWLIALGIIAGLAMTSAVFAMMWERFGGFPLVTTISFCAAASWCLGALTSLYFTRAALTTFCTCAAKVPACAAACGSLGGVLSAMTGALFALFGLSIVAAADSGLGWEIYLALAGAVALVTVLIVVLGIYGKMLGDCQGP